MNLTNERKRFFSVCSLFFWVTFLKRLRFAVDNSATSGPSLPWFSSSSDAAHAHVGIAHLRTDHVTSRGERLPAVTSPAPTPRRRPQKPCASAFVAGDLHDFMPSAPLCCRHVALVRPRPWLCVLTFPCVSVCYLCALCCGEHVLRLETWRQPRLLLCYCLSTNGTTTDCSTIICKLYIFIHKRKKWFSDCVEKQVKRMTWEVAGISKVGTWSDIFVAQCQLLKQWRRSLISAAASGLVFHHTHTSLLTLTWAGGMMTSDLVSLHTHWFLS